MVADEGHVEELVHLHPAGVVLALLPAADVVVYIMCMKDR